MEVARRVDVTDAGSQLPAKRLRLDLLRGKVPEVLRSRQGVGAPRRRPPLAGRLVRPVPSRPLAGERAITKATVLAGPAIFSGLLSCWAAADNEQMSDRFLGLLLGGAVQVERAGMVLAGAADGEPIMVRPLGLPR